MVVSTHLKNTGELYLSEVMIGLNVLMLASFSRGLNFVLSRVYLDQFIIIGNKSTVSECKL